MALLIPFIGVSTLVLWSSSDIFFWDTVQLASKHAHFFYENGLQFTLLPDIIDSGHIPIFGYYLALCWKLLGKTFFVSHLAMLPFCLGIVYQLFKLIKHYTSGNTIIWVLIVMCSEPTLVAQMSLVSPDIILIWSFLWLLNLILEKDNSILKYIAAIILGLISMRGTMVLVALFLFECTNDQKLSLKSWWLKGLQSIKYYLPAALFFIAYMSYHYSIKNWIGYHEDSPWAGSFERVELLGALKNVVVYVWRCMDFGRIGIFICLAFIWISQKSKNRINYTSLLWLLGFLILTSAYSFITYKGLSSHRYLLPIYLIILFYTCTFIIHHRYKHVLFSFMLICLWTGHLWRYPYGISQGWDASLAYKPYMYVWQQSYQYLVDEKIDISSVGSAFPNQNRISTLTLNDDQRTFIPLNIGQNPYILISNVMNDVKPKDLDLIQKSYSQLQEFKHLGIWMKLYKLNP